MRGNIMVAPAALGSMLLGLGGVQAMLIPPETQRMPVADVASTPGKSPVGMTLFPSAPGEDERPAIINLKCQDCPFAEFVEGTQISTFNWVDQENDLILNVTIDRDSSPETVYINNLAVSPMNVRPQEFYIRQEARQGVASETTLRHDLDLSYPHVSPPLAAHVNAALVQAPEVGLSMPHQFVNLLVTGIKPMDRLKNSDKFIPVGLRLSIRRDEKSPNKHVEWVAAEAVNDPSHFLIRPHRHHGSMAWFSGKDKECSSSLCKWLSMLHDRVSEVKGKVHGKGNGRGRGKGCHRNRPGLSFGKGPVRPQHMGPHSHPEPQQDQHHHHQQHGPADGPHRHGPAHAPGHRFSFHRAATAILHGLAFIAVLSLTGFAGGFLALLVTGAAVFLWRRYGRRDAYAPVQQDENDASTKTMDLEKAPVDSTTPPPPAYEDTISEKEQAEDKPEQ